MNITFHVWSKNNECYATARNNNGTEMEKLEAVKIDKKAFLRNSIIILKKIAERWVR